MTKSFFKFGFMLVQIRDYKLDRERVKVWVTKAWHVEHLTELTPVQFENLLTRLESWAGEEYAKAEAVSALSTDVYPFSGVVYEH
jgi:hypothetical protein